MGEIAKGGESFGDARRFSVARKLGAGGMGVVYLVRDAQRDRQVALKTLLAFEPADLLRLKSEFRAIAGIVHPNLVELYELIADGERWFFTMEYVEGVDFLGHVRGEIHPGGAGFDRSIATRRIATEASGIVPSGRAVSALDETLASDQIAPQVTGVDVTRPAGTAPPEGVVGAARHRAAVLDDARLRPALVQLAEAIEAIHTAGLLHLDIKPSNVLVTPGGRVVVLDFGLVADLHRRGAHPRDEQRASGGTAGYMAPEQGLGKQVSEASDWYAVGAMLYEILTGQLPFEGSVREVLLAKNVSDPRPARAVNPAAPDDLCALADALLQRDPSLRPRGGEVLRRLGHARSDAAIDAPDRAAMPALLVGREGHFERLHDAYQAMRAGTPRVVMLAGRSGMGKSALVQLFLESIASGGAALVLAGRCYERESVPYKAFDSLVDGLSQLLARRPRDAIEALLPPSIAALARLFPVLGQVPAIARALAATPSAPDPQELRRQGFVAFRHLVDRLAREQPLVLFLDDLQWGDLDSAALLSVLLRPPDPPRILLVGSFRSEDVAESPMLLALQRAWDAGALDPPIEVTVGPLTEPEALALALSVLREDDPDRQAKAARVSRESAGHPYFVTELARHADAFGQLTEGASLSLDAMIWGRVTALPDEARELLEVVAVAGRPIESELAFRAQQGAAEHAPQSGLDHAVKVLLARSMIRTSGLRDAGMIETFHDRVRESILDRLAPERARALHARLAATLTTTGGADAERLLGHLEAAGDRDEAARYAVLAADTADAALAFDRAASLYQKALDLRPDATEHRDLQEKRAIALANAGRGGDAGRAFLAAADGAPEARALDLRRRGAEQFLISGHTDAGTAALRSVLSAVGMRIAPTPRRALLAILGQRLFLRLRGLGFEERPGHALADDERTRIGICWGAAVGLSMVDNVRAADFQAKHLLLALRSGDPVHVSRAISFELGFVGGPGSKALAATAKLTADAERLATGVGTPYALSFLGLMKGVTDYLAGRFRSCLARCEEAESGLRERCSGVAWEVTSAQRFSLGSLMYLGKIRELRRRAPALLRRAEDRGNLFAATDLRTRFTLTWLAADDPDRVTHEVEDALARWSQEGFHLQHYNSLLALEQRDLYAGEAQVAWDRLDQRWKAIERSMLLRIQLLRIEVIHLRARLALSLAERGADGARFLALAARDATTIEKERAAWADPLAVMLRATLAAARGETARAVGLVDEAAKGFDGADMALHAAVARRRKGELVGGDEGRALVEGADAWMRGEEIVSPDRMSAMLAPGPWKGPRG